MGYVGVALNSVSRAGKDDGWNTTEGSLCTRRSSLISVRGSTENSMEGGTEGHSRVYEKLPFGLARWIPRMEDRYVMNVGDGRFGRWVAEMPDSVSFNASPVSSSGNVISRSAPLWRGMLEITVRAVIASQQIIDRC